MHLASPAVLQSSTTLLQSLDNNKIIPDDTSSEESSSQFSLRMSHVFVIPLTDSVSPLALHLNIQGCLEDLIKFVKVIFQVQPSMVTDTLSVSKCACVLLLH
mgnify:CR=1 FL=1